MTVGGGTPVTPSGAESGCRGESDNVNPPVTSTTGKEDAPFRDCLGYATVLKQPTEQPITKATPGKAAEITAFDPLVIYHFPSSATYTIEGRTSLVNVAKNVGGNGEFTIQIFKDLENNQDNQIGLENGAPQFVGKIVTNDLKNDFTGYKISRISTACDFISAVKPTVPSGVTLKSAPIGDINPKNREQGIEPGNDLALGGKEVNKDSDPKVLNSPLAQCTDESIDNAQVSVYNIRGKSGDLQSIMDDKDEKRSVSVKIFNDLVLPKTDHAQIFDENNRFIKIECNNGTWHQ